MASEIYIPKVGEDVYIDTSLFLGHGEDDFNGGLCEISAVFIDGDSVWVSVKEDESVKYNWLYLLQEQEKLKKEFGNNRGYKRPDKRPEFNEE